MPRVEKRGWNRFHGALLQRRRFYIGSTTVSVHSRHDARLRKFRLLQQGDSCNAELMLHYFRTHGDLFDAIILTSMIPHMKPELRSIRSSILGSHSLTHRGLFDSTPVPPPDLHNRLLLSLVMAVLANDFGKSTTKASHLRTAPIIENTVLGPYDNWLLLMNIANRGMKAFQTEKRLRSAEFHNHQVYARYRMCNLLDDPPQTFVRSVLRRILTCRQCAIPRGPKPLVLSCP